MADKPTTGTVPMNSAAVRQKHRMAAGLPVDGKTLPKDSNSGKKTPA
jgi:hypothetical protein